MPDYDVPPTIDGAVVSTSSSTATKPRRKRKKRKKKKKTDSEPSTIAIEDDSSDDEDGDFGIVINKDNTNRSININLTTKTKTNHGASNISTPQELLRRQLVEIDGYKTTQVEQAMEDMWDKGMPYDEYDSVINYLQSLSQLQLLFQSGVSGTTASTVSNSNSVLTVSTKEAEEGEVDFTATELDDHNLNVEETTTVIANCNGVINDVQEDGKEDEEQQCKREDEESAPEPAPEQAPTQPVTMMMKLDTVAGFENLNDAIFALGQWVKQAAKEEEIELFCRAEETSALPTVVRRGISSEIEDTKQFENVVKPALVRLLMDVLNQCGVVDDPFGAACAEAEIEEKVGTMLKQARKVILLASDERNIEDDETVIGDRVSRFIVSRLTIAMDDMKKYNKHDHNNDNNNNNNNCHQEEHAGSINAVNDNGNENDTAMATLLSQRDALKAEAIRACTTVQNSMESIFSDTTTANGHSHGMTNGHAGQDQPPSTTSSLEIQDMALHIVDQETKNKLDKEKSRLEALKSQVREEGEISDTVQSLLESKISLETKRLGYQEKIAELRAAIEELETQEKDAALKIERLSTQIGEEEQNDDANAKQLEQEISQAKESLRFENLVSGLAGMMKTYGKAIENATAFKTGKNTEQTSDDNKKANKTVAAAAEPVTKQSTSRAMEDYLSKIRNYFLKEAHCATQLRHRLATKTAEATALKSELSQYNSVKGLFATSTITSQIDESIAQNERTIKADTLRIAALTDDGWFMYDELLARLDTYSANTTTTTKESNTGSGITNGENDTDAEVLEAFFPTELLKGVPAAIRALNIVVQDCDDKLVPFVKEEQAVEETANETMTIESSASNQDCEGDGAPKLAWASHGTKATRPKQSLLDIQKEELDRSMENSTQSRG